MSDPSSAVEIGRVDAILEAVSFSAEQFMKVNNWELAIQQMLERLGRAAHVSRVYVFQDEMGADGILYSSQKYEWDAEGIKPQINNVELQNIPLRYRYPRWEEALKNGQPVLCIVKDLPESEQELLVAQDIKSIAIFPILVEHLHWGHIGFDDCMIEHQWSLAEMEALKAAAGIFGAAIERKRAEAALQEKNTQLAILSHQLVEIQETERRFIALELHDEIGQALTGIRLTLELGMQLPDLEETRVKIAQALKMVDALTGHVKDISHMLRPNLLDDLGLLPALLWLFENFSSQTQIQVSIQHVGISDRRFKPEVEITVYRVVQEALTNIARHSGADCAVVKTWANSHVIGVQIEDKGKGFNLNDMMIAKKAIGLTGIRERVRWLGGTMNIESSPDAGTRITAEIPLDSGSIFDCERR
ncbi:MAG: GAF domain-containing sensor histidine kinase [Anaerolineae bacterium]|nr:GAF domain-containing sensor histidine kinase [Anaerolineae bacterium]